MPLDRRIYSPGELQFLTTSTYRRAQVFRSPRFCHDFVQRFENPMKRGLVSSPGDWPWSNWRFYFSKDAPLLPMDRLG